MAEQKNFGNGYYCIGVCWDYGDDYTADAFVNCYSSGKVVASQGEYGNAFVGYTDAEGILF